MGDVEIYRDEASNLCSELMRAREVNIQNNFELKLLWEEMDSARAQLSSLYKELTSFQKELVVAKQCCIGLLETIVKTERASVACLTQAF